MISSRESWLDSALIARALAEDIGHGDVTTLACVPAASQVTGHIIARKPGVIAGLPVVVEVMRQVDPAILIEARTLDGTAIAADEIILTFIGPARGVLQGERVALNFLGRLSGIATITARCVAAIAGTGARILDTRKTTPGLRAMEKYAVRMGGGTNHRFGLDDGILIKDNHIVASGGVSAAIRNARASGHHLLRIEVECDQLSQVREALDSGVDAILLDNMTLDELRAAVAEIRRRAPATSIEASGRMGTDPQKLHAVAATGVDFISIGALTHSVTSLDLSMEFDFHPTHE